ncbi:vir-repressed protein [Chromobacterium subtsugae]|uniref:vir-repressed protein n=1 Tax=Chromobacterium subtsugae TaxID=251747 RepID=UPI000ADD5904|nr:vir-repressed protein [Chromobacterium subtsugae]
MKTWILAIIAIGSLSGCVVEPPRVGIAPVVVRPAVVVAPAYYYGPRYYGWR